MTSIMISHKLNEIAEIADTTTIIRDGRTVETLDMVADEVTQERIIRGMVGRDLGHRFPPHESHIGEEVLRIEDWTVHHPTDPDRIVVDGANLTVRAGEIVGLAGLMGAGRTELAMSVFGRSYGSHITGKVFLHGKEIRVATRLRGDQPRHRVRHRGPQEVRPEPHRGHPDQHLRREPVEGVARWLGEQQRGDQGRRELPPEHEHQGTDGAGAHGEAVRRQPAEGRAEQVALHGPAGADPRRAHARHRRRRQVRDLHPDQPARRGGQGRAGHLLGAARAARHLQPDLHALGRPDHRRRCRGSRRLRRT